MSFFKRLFSPKNKYKDTDSAQGQQQKGNHGGGAMGNLKEGNQPRGNSAKTATRDQGGDFPGGRKAKKR